MKTTKAIALSLALAGITLGTVFAANRGAQTNAETKCYPTADGKYVCKETGKTMDAPCCVKSCCKK